MQKIFVAMLLASSVHFSSCSYQIFYPQRVSVYAFDSAHQTKTITRPYMQIVGTQLGVSHSFSNHFFLETTTQLNSTIFHLRKEDVAVTARTAAYSVNVGAGFYVTTKKKNGFEIVPQFIHEHNEIFYRYFTNYIANPTPAFVNERINYLMPAIQFSYYHFPVAKNNFSATCRVACQFADEFQYGISLENEVNEKGFYLQNILLQPGIHFSLKKIPELKVECSAIIGLKKTSLVNYYSPVMLSLMLNPELLKRW